MIRKDLPGPAIVIPFVCDTIDWEARARWVNTKVSMLRLDV